MRLWLDKPFSQEQNHKSFHLDLGMLLNSMGVGRGVLSLTAYQANLQ